VTETCEIAIVGSGFAGSLLARVLAVLGYDVVLIERGTHPRFAIGESTTPLANLSLERIGARYGFADCYRLATHGRWLAHFPELRRGLKRGFTFYRHHPNEPFADRGFDCERLLVAASPEDAVADTHWVRADVDHHFVREAIAAGVDYRDHTSLTGLAAVSDGLMLQGSRDGSPFTIRTRFLVDASGPGGFLARLLPLSSIADRMETRSALVFGHFENVGLMRDVCRGLPEGPYPDDWAAVHHLIDEGWMYSLRFDHGVTSAGFLLTPPALRQLGAFSRDPVTIWERLLQRYPTLRQLFTNAEPLFPIRFQPTVQHRLGRVADERWVLMPHTYTFVDPLFSTGIAWGLLAVERLAFAFEESKQRARRPSLESLRRYEALLSAEAEQIDLLVAGAYQAMARFELFAAQAMLYFAAVSFAEVRQRVLSQDDAAWSGFLGVHDEVLDPLPRETLGRLRAITQLGVTADTTSNRREFVDWIATAIESRNVAGLADASRYNLYPVDLNTLIDRHQLLGLSRDRLIGALPALRGRSPEPAYVLRAAEGRGISRSAPPSPVPETPAPR
jgi:tetracycline 7-halogenase / FADH2 O2-dependent halogenase